AEQNHRQQRGGDDEDVVAIEPDRIDEEAQAAQRCPGGGDQYVVAAEQLGQDQPDEAEDLRQREGGDGDNQPGGVGEAPDDQDLDRCAGDQRSRDPRDDRGEIV